MVMELMCTEVVDCRQKTLQALNRTNSSRNRALSFTEEVGIRVRN